MISSKILELEHIYRFFVQGNKVIQILNDLSLSVTRGEKIAIIGASGSGKSTLMHLLAGLDRADGGVIRVLGYDTKTFSDNEYSTMRNRWFGFVYQFHHLLLEFTSLENVAMPLLIRRESMSYAYKKASQILEQVGLLSRLHYSPSLLSGGERQRVAIARAMVTNPICILADEPTGNLDHVNALSVCDLLCELSDVTGVSLVIATHDAMLARRCDKVFTLTNGRLR